MFSCMENHLRTINKANNTLSHLSAWFCANKLSLIVLIKRRIVFLVNMLMMNITPLYRVGQIKRSQLTFLLVTSGRISEIKDFWQV